MKLTAQQRAERHRLSEQLAQLAGTPVPAALTIALYDLQRRGHELHLVDHQDLEHAASILRDADRHALLIIRASDRRRLLRRTHLQRLHRPADLPSQLAQLANRTNDIRYRRTHGTGTATFIPTGNLIIIDARADFQRHVSRRTREGIQQRHNDHATARPARDQGREARSARVSG